MKQLRNRFKPKNKYQYNLTITFSNGNSNGVASFLDATISATDEGLSYLNEGIYDLWCLDREIGYALGNPYTDFYAFSSTEAQKNLIETPLKKTGTSASNTFKYAENLNLVQWLINQNYNGRDPFGIGTNITVTNIQQAIWVLLNQYPETFVPNSRVSALIGEAKKYGENFMAARGQKIGLIISNSKKNEFGQMVPRTQPQLLQIKATELQIETPQLLLLRRISKSKYLHLQTIYSPTRIKGLIPGFEYIIKNKKNREIHKISLQPDEFNTFQI